MQVKVFGPFVSPGPDGNLTSWGPNHIVEVDTGDKKAVAFFRRWIEAGTAEVVEGKLPATATAPSSDKLDIEGEGELVEPPRAGPGSGRAAWVTYAESQGLDVTDDMTRDDIIAAIDEG